MYEQSDHIGAVNQCLVELGETPITKKKLQSKKYSKQKLEVLAVKMGEAMLGEKQKLRCCNSSKRNLILPHKIVRKCRF